MTDRDLIPIPREVVEDAIALLTSTTADYREAFNAGAVARVVAALRAAWMDEKRQDSADFAEAMLAAVDPDFVPTNEKPTPEGAGFRAEPAREPRDPS